MSTTSLFAEILIIGAIADIWLFLILLAILSPSGLAIAQITQSLDQISLILAVPFLAVTYALGWIVNFLADRLFRRLFQSKARDRIVEEACLEDKGYHHVRGYFSQKASDRLVQDWDYTRHSIRIARSNVMNFIALAIALSLHLSRHPRGIMVAVGLCIAIASLAFWQAATLSGANYRRLMVVYRVLREEDAKEGKDKASVVAEDAN